MHSPEGIMTKFGTTLVSLLPAALVLAASGAAAAPAAQPGGAGEAVYGKYCATCHDHPDGRVPPRDTLKGMPPARILRTLDFGLMMSIAYPIKREDRQAVANFLGTGADEPAIPPSALCKADRPILPGPTQAVWNGWGPDASNMRFQGAENAGLYVEQVSKLVLKWAFGFPGDVTTFGAPTILNGTLFTGSAGGGIYAIDAKTGCLHWVFQAHGPVRSAPLAVTEGGTTTLVFGDQNGEVYALDARTGKQRWRKRIEEHEATRLTASPAVSNGVVFIPAASWEETRSVDLQYPCCTFRGSVTAVNVRDGSIAWKTFLVDPPKRTGQTKIGTPTFGPSGAGVWSTPTVDQRRGVLYITTGDNYSHPANDLSDAFIALDLNTGKVVWSQQTFPKDVYNSSCGQKTANCPDESGPDYDYGASAMLVHTIAGRDVLVAGQKSGVVFGLDPDAKGKILWQQRVGKGGTNGGVEWGTASDGRYVYAATSDLVQLAGDTHKVAPVGDANLDPEKGGGLTALSAVDGEKTWFAPGIPCKPARPGCSPAQPGAVTALQGAVFSGSMDGHIRAYSTVDGKVIWDFDTEKAFKAVNGVPAKGGALNGAGPVIAGGMVFVNSGYPRQGGTPGNVLLAFGLPD
jgi:polyvinyl alcohol dehydrogenase (cytochrome)